MIASRPPGRSTRSHSSSAASGCGSVHSTCRLITRSKLPSGYGQVLGVALLEAHRETLRRRLLARPGHHRRGEIDAGHAVPARRQFERQKPGAAADIERVERAAPGTRRDHEIENAVPGGALGGAADAVAEILVEMRRAPVPMRRDLLL